MQLVGKNQCCTFSLFGRRKAKGTVASERSLDTLRTISRILYKHAARVVIANRKCCENLPTVRCSVYTATHGVGSYFVVQNTTLKMLMYKTDFYRIPLLSDPGMRFSIFHCFMLFVSNLKFEENKIILSFGLNGNNRSRSKSVKV